MADADADVDVSAGAGVAVAAVVAVAAAVCSFFVLISFYAFRLQQFKLKLNVVVVVVAWYTSQKYPPRRRLIKRVLRFRFLIESTGFYIYLYGFVYGSIQFRFLNGLAVGHYQHYIALFCFIISV